MLSSGIILTISLAWALLDYNRAPDLSDGAHQNLDLAVQVWKEGTEGGRKQPAFKKLEAFTWKAGKMRLEI